MYDELIRWMITIIMSLIIKEEKEGFGKWIVDAGVTCFM